MCLSLLYLYVIYGMVMNWFFVLNMYEFLYILINYLKLYEICFIVCVGLSVFGIYFVEYFWWVYDKKSNFFIFWLVKYLDKIYVFLDLLYFYKMDKVMKDRKEEII